MKEAFTFLTAIVILAIAQTLTTALGIMLLIFGLMGVVAFPKPTFGLIASLGLLVLALKAPAMCAAALGTIGVAVAITDWLTQRKAAEERPPRPLLPAPDRMRNLNLDPCNQNQR